MVVIFLITIDGSHGEGGGQILRSAIALSVLTKKPVNIKNIRANRPSPGLKPQHYTAIKIIKNISNAKTEGLEIGSSNLIFTPGEIKGGNYNFDIGTAGSIVLVFQACLLAFVYTNEEINIKLTGGTDVKWSPSWDYFEHVFIPMVKKIGLSVNVELINRGYYPKGGGIAKISIKPFQKLVPLNLESNQNFDTIKGKIHLGNLPEHIGKRMKHSTIKILVQNNLKSIINIESVKSLSTGDGNLLTIANLLFGYTPKSLKYAKSVGFNLIDSNLSPCVYSIIELVEISYKSSAFLFCPGSCFLPLLTLIVDSPVVPSVVLLAKSTIGL